MIELLNNTLLKHCEDDKNLVASLNKLVKEDINLQYTRSGMAILLKVASLLDPWFNYKYIEEFFGGDKG